MNHILSIMIGVLIISFVILSGCTDPTQTFNTTSALNTSPVPPGGLRPGSFPIVLDHVRLIDSYWFWGDDDNLASIKGTIKNENPYKVSVRMTGRFLDEDKVPLAYMDDVISDVAPGLSADFNVPYIGNESDKIASWEIWIDDVYFPPSGSG